MSVGPSVTFLNCGRFLHYCPCPTVRDIFGRFPYHTLGHISYILILFLHDRKTGRDRGHAGDSFVDILSVEFGGYVFEAPLAVAFAHHHHDDVRLHHRLFNRNSRFVS